MDKKKKLLTPKATMKIWDDLVEEMKPKRPGGRKAKEIAKLAGMRSIGEVRCAADMKSKKLHYAYEHIKLNAVIKSTYTPDFVTTLDDGSLLVIEYKGKMVGTTRSKIKAILETNPDIHFCMVFERSANKLSARPASMKYFEWANKLNIPNNERYVKPEWFTTKFWEIKKKHE